MSHMGDIRDEQSRTHQGVRSYDETAITAAQRLAAADVDIRLAMSEVWWAALRVGLALGHERPVILPNDPFSGFSMELAGYDQDGLREPSGPF
jgi:hypothetical protein